MRVLLVEDDTTTSKSITMMLASEGFVCDATDLGEDGLEIGRLYDYDIIILELMLPDIDGCEVLRRLRAARVDLVLICPDSAESWFYDTDGSARTLNEALRADDPPAFLRPIALPAPLSEQFKLFALRPSGA